MAITICNWIFQTVVCTDNKGGGGERVTRKEAAHLKGRDTG